jgi:prepilin-type N-terminal cleavage/methylation domain-containing protein
VPGGRTFPTHRGVLRVNRLRQPAGFTLVEVLVAGSVLGIVVLGAMTMMQVVLRQGTGVVQRTEAAQRGRLALDQMTRQIRSQVCLDETTTGLVAASPTALTFYADLGDGRAGVRPTRRMLEYHAATQTLRESVWVANAAGTYPAVATRSAILLDTVEPTPGVPVFGYYAYPAPLPTDPRPSEQFAGSLTATQLRRVAMVRLNFTVRPRKTADRSISTPLRDDIQLRNADPYATTPDPTCR